jgi:hypothetical protein
MLVRVRVGKNLRRGFIVAVLVVAVVVASCIPQLITGKGTFKEATAVCVNNFSTRTLIISARGPRKTKKLRQIMSFRI